MTNDPGRSTEHTPSYAEEQLDYIEERDSKRGRSPEQAEQPAGVKRDWVPCPVCGDSDMRRETDCDNNVLIFCVNHNCRSNSGTMDVRDTKPAGASRECHHEFSVLTNPPQCRWCGISAGASGEKWHSTVQVNQTWPCSCTDGNHRGGHYVHADYLNALEAKADRLDMETCKHEVVSRLKDAGEHGSQVLTDWEWCAGCGAVKLAHNQTWTKPANGTPNLPAKLNNLTDRLRAAEAALDATMIRHDEETQRLYTDMRAAEADAERLAGALEAVVGYAAALEKASAAWFTTRRRAKRPDATEASKKQTEALAAHTARKESENA